MGLFRRNKSTPPPAPDVMPETSVDPGLVVDHAPAVPPPDVVQELRAAAMAASAAADRAGNVAEDARRQAMLATETARNLSEASQPPASHEQLIALTVEVEKLAALVRTSITESREAREMVTSLDTRITQLGVELANQIDELSGDVDSLASREPAENLSDETVADLKSGQVRLAQEQARYQIAFREDLAALADEVHKRPTR